VNEEEDTTSEEEDEKDSDGGETVAPWVSGPPTVWGANFSLCEVGTYAVVQSVYEDDHKGVSVVKVTFSLIALPHCSTTLVVVEHYQ
jgi:hypothetical protein